MVNPRQSRPVAPPLQQLRVLPTVATRVRWVALVAVMTIQAAPGLSIAAADDILPVMRKCWAEYETQFTQWKSTANVRLTVQVTSDSADGDTLDAYTLSLHQSKPGSLVDYDSQTMGRELLGLNSDYAFSVKPAPSFVPDAQWVMTGIERRDPDCQVCRRTEQLLAPNLDSASLLDVVGIPLPQLFAAPGLTIDSAEESGEEMRVSFRLPRSPDLSPAIAFVRSGTLVLRKDHLYGCTRAELSTEVSGEQGRFVMTKTLGVGGEQEFASWASSVDATDQSRAASSVHASIAISLIPGEESVPGTAYRLPYYGFSEPEWASASGRTVWLWLVGAAICLTAAIAIRRMKAAA